ncbi:Uncharacterised protein [Mycobacteroides abscessus subsp. abscessus]|nr:Uncharacterised protein [Mycobacteroides abscessus subsp. abscessus]
MSLSPAGVIGPGRVISMTAPWQGVVTDEHEKLIVVICWSRTRRVVESLTTVIARVADSSRAAAGAATPSASAASSAASASDEAVAASCDDATSVACVLSSAALARMARGVSDVTRSERAARLAAPATPTRARNGRSRDIDFSFCGAESGQDASQRSEGSEAYLALTHQEIVATEDCNAWKSVFHSFGTSSLN